jgi:hypothetical protein
MRSGLLVALDDIADAAEAADVAEALGAIVETRVD